VFETLKAKLSAVEAKVVGVVAAVNAQVAAAEAEVRGLDRGVSAPLDKVAASAAQGEATVTQAIAPLRQ
jgi:hypothetical protein